MEAYRNQYAERYQTRNRRAKLNMYVTFAPCGSQGMDCARALRTFAEDYNFHLNIKVVGPYHQNEEELQHLMASRHCTVKAFMKKDHIALAQYLGHPLPGDWRPTQAMIDRDRDTRRKLKEIQQRNNINMDCLEALTRNMRIN